MNEEKVIQEIFEKHNIPFNDIKKSQSGFTNDVYFINDKYVIKIARDKKKSEKLKKEIEFYKNSTMLDCLPKYIVSGGFKDRIYLIIEKLEGITLYNVWHTLKEYQRENIVKQIATILRQINNLNFDFLDNKNLSLNWKEKWKKSFDLNIGILKEKNFDTDFLERFVNTELIDKIFDEQNIKLVYNDAHFDNFILNNGKLYIIDFDRIFAGSVDYELLIIDSMLDNPIKFASEEEEQLVNVEHYKNVRTYLKRYYTEMYDFKYLQDRLFIYKFFYKLGAGYEYDRPQWIQRELDSFYEWFKDYLFFEENKRDGKVKEIDVENWNRRKQFRWFNTFSNPCYTINSKIDCTEVVKVCKENQKSFFVSFMYLVMKALNSIEEFRLRYIDGKVYLFDTINPAFTVMTNSGVYENARHQMKEDFNEFYDLSRKVIDSVKEQKKVKDEYNSNMYDEYYLTTTPWLDFDSATHPIPDDKNSLSVPRICWGKYTLKEGRYKLTLNINVSHVLIDGYPVCRAFNEIQKLCDNCRDMLKW